jgi:hypothetical protein
LSETGDCEGQQVRRGDFLFDEWMGGIKAQLEKILPEDEAVRRRAASESAKIRSLVEAY